MPVPLLTTGRQEQRQEPLGLGLDVARRQFDLRDTFSHIAVPGDVNYITLPPGAYRYVSWWSDWPLQRLQARAATLLVQGRGTIHLCEAEFNLPLDSAGWLVLVNEPLVPMTPCRGGTYLLNLLVHNAPLRPVLGQLPFVWADRFELLIGEVVRIGWGSLVEAATAVYYPVTGYAPFSKLRVLTTSGTGVVTSIEWRGLSSGAASMAVPEVFVDSVTHNPPASESADLILDNSGGGATQTLDVFLEFSNSV